MFSKTKKRAVWLIGMLLLISVGISFAVGNVGSNEKIAYAISPNEVAATYSFTRINDTDCDVKITNKDVATKAIVPSYATIDGR